MKRMATLLAVTSVLCGAQIAGATQRYTPPASVATFSGPVTVQKDLGTYNCTLTVTVTTGPNAATDLHGGVSITTPHADTATATAALSGGFPCPSIQVNGTANVTYNGTNLSLAGFTIVPPLSFGTCTGPIVVAWGGATTPRRVVLSVPLSNSTATAGAPCKMAGTLLQTSGPALDVFFP